MVLFYNLKLNARVQVKWRGEVLDGTVRYTGGLVTRSGDWVGVELDERAGDNSGLYKGIQYFHCRNGYGIFVHAHNVRFVWNHRLHTGRYKLVAKDSVVDELLFTKCGAPRVKTPTDPEVISLKYMEEAKSLFTAREDPFQQGKGFHKSHLIGRWLMPGCQRHAKPIHHGKQSRVTHEEHFITPPSIPDYHVPRTALKRMIEMDYFGTSIPRHSSLS